MRSILSIRGPLPFGLVTQQNVSPEVCYLETLSHAVPTEKEFPCGNKKEAAGSRVGRHELSET